MSADLERLLDGSTPGGVYHLSPPDVPAQPEIMALADQLTKAGWRVVLIPPVDRSGDFYRAVASQLDLPPWFGGNLDALWDVLSNLREPTALVLMQWTRLAAARPQWSDRMMAVLRERSETQPAFALILA